MLTGIHFLLTYQCPYECSHCFVYGGPRARGTFTLEQILAVLQEAQALGTVQTVFFEGGEPFRTTLCCWKGCESPARWASTRVL